MVTAKDKEFAGHLVRNLEGANQDVPQELLDIAMQVRQVEQTWLVDCRHAKQSSRFCLNRDAKASW